MAYPAGTHLSPLWAMGPKAGEPLVLSPGRPSCGVPSPTEGPEPPEPRYEVPHPPHGSEARRLGLPHVNVGGLETFSP